MKKMTEIIPRFIWRYRKLVIILAILTILSAAFQVITYAIPHPLGNGFSYLGQKAYKLNIWQSDFLYYYGTSMTVSEMERYFETTALSTPSERTSKFTKITLSNAITQQSCDLYYYDSSAIDSYHTDKKHIVILRSAEYENIKTSVRK